MVPAASGFQLFKDVVGEEAIHVPRAGVETTGKAVPVAVRVAR